MGTIVSLLKMYERCQSEPGDFFLLLSHKNMNRLLAPAQVGVKSARYDVVAKCAAGGQPQSTSSRCGVAAMRDVGRSRLI